MITDQYNRAVSDKSFAFVESVQSSLVSPCLQKFTVIVSSTTGSKDLTESYLELAKAVSDLSAMLNKSEETVCLHNSTRTEQGTIRCNQCNEKLANAPDPLLCLDCGENVPESGMICDECREAALNN